VLEHSAGISEASLHTLLLFVVVFFFLFTSFFHRFLCLLSSRKVAMRWSLLPNSPSSPSAWKAERKSTTLIPGAKKRRFD